ncbi:MAG: sulfatase-like hydrolase/transferase [Acidobacteriota bacterium]
MRSRPLLIGIASGVMVVLAGAALIIWVFGTGAPRFRGATGDANVLLITIDTLRADRVGAYGSGKVKTPVIDALAGNGILFENAVSPAVMTLPAHASILTGTYPPTHGIRDNGDYRLGDSALTVAEVLRSRGLKTGAVTGAFVLDSMFGLNQGFDEYDDALPSRAPNEIFLAERPAAAVTDAAVRFLDAVKGSRFFLWVHYFDPHQPYAAPAPYSEQYPDAPYDAEVAYVDAEVGRLLASMRERGMMDHTLVVLVADHGEGLKDHGEASHGVFLYEEATHVPLIISFPPFIPSGRRVSAVVSSVDIMPTILDLVRIDPRGAAAPVQGRSLWPLMATGKDPDPRAAYSEAMAPWLLYGWSPLTAIRDTRFKYIKAPRPELYDLVADPGETNNLVPSRPDLVATYRERLASLRRSVTRHHGPAEKTSLDEDERSRLRSLGYAAGGAVDPNAVQAVGKSPADPKDRVAMLDRINHVYTLFGVDRHEDVLREAGAILAEDPDNASVRFYMAGSLSKLGRYDEAIREFQRLLERKPDDTEVLSDIAWCQTNLGRFDEAEATYKKVLEIYPDHIHADSSLGNLAFIQGRYQEAARIYKAVLKKKPNHLPALLTLARMYEAGQRLEEAEVFYEQATRVDPTNIDTWLNLGWARFQQGKQEEALEALREAQARAPRTPEIQVALGDVYMAMKRIDEARAAYQAGIAIQPRLPGAHYGLGLIALEEGDAAEAVESLHRAIRLRPERPVWREDLARALAASGDRKAAAEQLERYLSSGKVPADKIERLRRRIRQYRDQDG